MLSLFFGKKAFLYQQLLKVTLGTSMCFVVILCMVPTYIQVSAFQRVFFVSVCFTGSFKGLYLGSTPPLAIENRQKEKLPTPNSNPNKSK